MKEALRKTGWLIVTVAAAAAAGYVFHFVASRQLGPVRYGRYTVLLSLMLAFARPLEALAPFAAGLTIDDPERGWADLLWLSLLAGGMLGAALIAFGLVWGGALGLSSRPALWLGGATLVAWSLLFLARGLLQGKLSDGPYLANRPIELLGRLVFAWPFLAVGGGLAGAIFASGVGALAGIVSALVALKRSWLGRSGSWGRWFDRRTVFEFLRVMLIWLAAGFFIGLDMILIGRQLSPAAGGFYAIANLIGKGALLYAVVLAPLIYPRLVRHGLTAASGRYLVLGLAYAALIFSGTLLVFGLAGDRLVPLLFGQAFAPAAPLVPVYLAVAFLMMPNYLVLNLQAAAGGWRDCGFVWLELAGYCALIYFCPPGLSGYFWRIGAGQLACAAAGLLALKSWHTRPR